MVSKAILSFVLLLAVSSPVLMAATKASTLPRFTSFVATTPPPPIAQSVEYFEKALVTADPKVSRGAYLAGYQTLAAADKTKISHEYKALKSRIDRLRSHIKLGKSLKAAQANKKATNIAKPVASSAPAKKLVANSQTKSKAQTAALKAPKKINNSVPHNAEEAKTVNAEVQKLIKQHNAEVEARKAAVVAGLKIVGEDKANIAPKKTINKIADQVAIKAAFEKLNRADQLKAIARHAYEKLRDRVTLERAVLGWKLVKSDIKTKLTKLYSVTN